MDRLATSSVHKGIKFSSSDNESLCDGLPPMGGLSKANKTQKRKEREITSYFYDSQLEAVSKSTDDVRLSSYESQSQGTLQSNERSSCYYTDESQKTATSSQKKKLETDTENASSDFSIDECISSADERPSSAVSSTKKPKRMDLTKRYSFLVEPKDKSLRDRTHPEYDPSTLYIPQEYYDSFPEFEKQYWKIKSQYFDSILFIKKGKFYELYEGDAEIGNALFNLKLIDRVNMKLVGIPEARSEKWIKKFVFRGYKVVVADQKENGILQALRTKGSKKEKIITREVTRIVTKGTLTDPTVIGTSDAVYCASLFVEERSALLLLDAATRTLYHKSSSLEDALAALCNFSVSELVVNPRAITESLTACARTCGIKLIKRTEVMTETEVNVLRARFRSEPQEILFAFKQLEGYLDQLLSSHLLMGKDLPLRCSAPLILNASALKNLEVFSNGYNGTSEGSLLSVVDNCVTNFGKRLLRRWIAYPLQSVEEIRYRQSCAQWLYDNPLVASELTHLLRKAPDVERYLARCYLPPRIDTQKKNDTERPLAFSTKALVNCTPGDLKLVIEGLGLLQSAIDFLRTSSPCEELSELISIEETPLDSFSKRYVFEQGEDNEKGLVIKPRRGADTDYDSACDELKDAERRITEYAKQQERVVKSPIKLRSIGKELFQMEVPCTTAMPSGYALLSKTKSVNRYWTSEMRNLVDRYKEARELYALASTNVLNNALRLFSEYSPLNRVLVATAAELDCYLSFSIYRRTLSFSTVPTFVPQRTLRLKGFVAPLLRGRSVPNDLDLSCEHNTLLLSGPNMGGKSTILRAAAQLVLQAQTGMAVPAEHAELSPVDKIFTRIGASDAILDKRSTFMVELEETNKILKEATTRSLAIIDELGRGTGSIDGAAIAAAVLWEVSEKIECTSLFTTHYHLILRDGLSAKVKLAHMKISSDFVYLYKLVDGISKGSYGIRVAIAAKIPEEVIREAKTIYEHRRKDSTEPPLW